MARLGLGLGSEGKQTSFTKVEGITGVKDIVASGVSTMLLMEDGTIMASGYNEGGQLGFGDTNERDTFTAINGISGVKDIEMCEYNAVLLMNDGTIMTAGDNYYGQLGLGDTSSRTSFTKVEGITGVKSITIGGECTLLLMNDNTVKLAGKDSLGVNHNTFVDLVETSEVSDVFAGIYYAVVLFKDGTSNVWGIFPTGR